MSTPVVFNGVTYNIPAYDDEGWAQGAGNLSQYLIALASGTYTQAGGLLSLTSPLNFGPNYGLLSLYFSAQSVNPAAAGVIRLEKTDTIDWRNNANTADNVLAVNNLDQLEYNGVVIGAGTGVSSITGTANEVIASSPTGAVTLSLPQAIATTSSPTFANLTLTNPLPVADGGTGTTTPSLVAGTNVSITGSWPNQTVNATSSGSVGSGAMGDLPYYAAAGTALSDSLYINYNGFSTLMLTSAPANAAIFEINGQSNGAADLKLVTSAGDGYVAQCDNSNNFNIYDVSNNHIFLQYIESPQTLIANEPLSMTSHQINNLANGTSSTDAVNLSQLTSGLTPNIAASGTSGASASSTTIASVSFTSHGNPVVIMANVTFSVTQGGTGSTLTFTVDDGSIVPQGCVSAFTDVLVSSTTTWQATVIGTYTPSAGTRTYTFKYSATLAPSISITYDSLVVYEL